MTWGKWICTACATIGTACVCVATGGLAAPAILGYTAVAGGVGFFAGDKIDEERYQNEEKLLKNQRYKDAKEATDRQWKENEQNRILIQNLLGKINGTIPLKDGESIENFQQQLIIAQSNLKSGEKKYDILTNDLAKIRKELIGSGNLMSFLGFDKLKFMDKVMIAGGIVLVIYLIKS